MANAHHFLHRREIDINVDASFNGVEKRDGIKAVQREGLIKTDINWHVAQRRRKLKTMPEGLRKELLYIP